MKELHRIHIEYSVFNDCYEVYVLGFDRDGLGNHVRSVLGEGGWEPVEDGGRTAPSFCVPRRGLAQSPLTDLANQLWSLDIVPAKAKGSAGQLEALQQHLRDMREVAFNRLKIE